MKPMYCYYCSNELTYASDLPSCADHGVLWPLVRNSVCGDAVLVNGNNEVLLGRRAKEPNKDLWGMPGRFTNYGEHPKDTAVRETLEETGWRAEVQGLVGVYLETALGDPSSEHRVSVTYALKAIAQVQKPDAESTELAWFPLNSLPSDIAPTHLERINDYREGK
jgi:8-oxo-dGTP diphosphatase